MKEMPHTLSAGELLSQQLYWVNKLSGRLPETTLPADKLRPTRQAGLFETYCFDLPASVSEKVVKLAKSSDLSIYLILVSALTVLLHRYTDDEDVIIGSPVYKATSDTGSTNNLVPLRFEVASSLKFKDHLLRVKQTVLEAYSNQDYPFEKIVELLKISPQDSRFPVFDIIVLLENIHDESCVKEVRNNITFSFAAQAHNISGKVRYNPALFEQLTIKRAVVHYTNVLRSVLQNINTELSKVSLLTEEEERRLLVGFNQSARPLPQNQTISQLFEAQALKTPDRLAVVFEKEQVSYQQLDQSSNRLARILARQGIGPDVVVALLDERNINLLTAIMAVFKAGGAYLPLDPGHPPQRICQLLNQSATPLVLVASKFEGLISEALAYLTSERRPQVLPLEQLLRQEEVEENLPPRSEPGNLAYVIYTSGSTGLPKGAMVEHKGMLNHLYAKVSDLELTGADRVAQTASQCFDISVWQFLAALLVGGQVHIYSDEVAFDPSRLLARVVADRISILETVPTLMRAMLEEVAFRGATRFDLSALRWLIPTGEALPPELVRQWLSYYPNTPLLNAYGPTECSDDVTHYPIYQPPAEDVVNMPIGRPVSNMRLYVLDRHLQPLPIGLAGELYVGGVGVGRGYLNDPLRTAEAFVPDPFAQEPGARLYKTGDVARYLPDGDLEFLGRVDYQVKIHGFRIELGEIETTLSQHPGVREAVVVAREDRPGEKRLVAYLVPHREQSPSINELRGFLSERLPDYMLPSAFVMLETLPLTPNGKIDRKALPAPDQTRPELETTYVAPSTPEEETLQRIWTEVLGLERVGVHDNFFELGGDSIRSIQVIARANQAGLRLTPMQVFQHPTIAALAAVAGTSEVVRAEQGIVTGPVPLTPSQLWFFEQRFADPHHYNLSFLREVLQPLEPVLLEQAIQQLLIHHDALRLRFRETESGWQQFNAGVEDAVPLTVIDLSLVAPQEQGAAIESAARQLQASLNLSEGPLLRVAYFTLGAQQADRVIIIFHHLVTDPVSIRFLMEDFQTVYQQLSRGEAVTLPPKTSSFRAWAQQLSEYAQSTRLRQELDFWVEMLKDADSSLPVDYPNGLNSEDSADKVLFSFSADETQALLQEVPAASGAQIEEVLLTAMVETLAHWSGKRTLLVDLFGHGREGVLEKLDLSRTVGWAVSFYPVLLDLRNAIEPLDAIKTVKERIHSVPNRGIGYGLLRYLCEDDEIRRQMRALPTAKVHFNYHGQFDQRFSESIPFRPAREFKGPERSLRSHRGFSLMLVGGISGGQLQMYWNYSKNIYRRATIERLAIDFTAELRSLVSYCLEVGISLPSGIDGKVESQPPVY